MKRKLLYGALVAALLLSGCSNTGVSPNGEIAIKGDDLKCGGASADHERVFYEIFVGSFSDSDGDGTGDLRGIIERFDYLNDGKPDSGFSLGVEGIWLTPIFSSPSYHKYDVADYYTIDESFGTEEDLKELIELCHKRDVKLILDLPINHTSDNNEWFTAFVEARRTGDKDSLYYDFYTVSDSASVDGRVFSQISGTSEYYECNFSGDMPELNFDNTQVTRTVTDVAEYYLNMGVDGFRFDAAKYIFLGEESRNVEFWKDYISALREADSDIFTVAEVWAHDTITEPYFSATSCFNFSMSQLSGQIATAAKGGDVNSYTKYVEENIRSIKAQSDSAVMIPFIANHDMDRAAGFLPVSGGEMRMAANLYLLSPGAPFIYYGEEIGMKGSRGSANTDANRRLAMLWGDSDTVADPEGTTYTSDKQINGTVAEQIADSDSLYNHYKRLIMIRRANPEIAQGDYRALEFANTRLGGFVSELDGSKVAVLHNTADEEITVDSTLLTSEGFSEIRSIIGAGAASFDGGTLTLGAGTSVVIR